MKFDAIIIGFGKGGKTLAGALAKMGKNVALVEKSEKMYGGTCINVGCIPSKSLVTSAAQAVLYGDAPFAEKAERYAAAIAEKRRVTTMLRGKNYDKLNTLDNVTIYTGTASFVSNTQVQVALPNETIVIEGEKIFINTGATAVIPAIPGLENNPFVYTSEQLMDEIKLPKRLVLIGAGYIGVEFANLYSAFGSEVTILQDGDTFLPREDGDIAQEIRKIMENKGIRFYMGAKVNRLDGGKVHFTAEGGEYALDADAILIATGRRPNTDGLNVEAAGVSLTPRGAVKVDDYLKTDAPNIWAMGDVVGGLQFTYISLDDYRIVLSQLKDEAPRGVSARKNVPYSVFMAPAFSRVGINETEAKQQGIPVRVLRMPAAAIPKAQVLRKTEGVLKAIVHAQTGKILGAMLLNEESYEMINIVKLAMDMDADYTVLRDQIFTHPTMSEALNDLFSL